MDQKQKISAILSVILTAVIALLAVFGYHVVVVQPQITALETAGAEAAAWAAAPIGTNGRSADAVQCLERCLADGAGGE